jgi:hypothetical protein
MNNAYQWSNTSKNYNIPNADVTQLNSYLGGVYQQSTSGVTNTSKSEISCNCSDANQILDQNCYTQVTGCFSTYGYQYKPGIYFFFSSVLHELTPLSGYSADGAVSETHVFPIVIFDAVFTQYISWITNDVVGWTLDAGALVADPVTEISDRPIPQEPMVKTSFLGCSLAHALRSTLSPTWASLRTSKRSTSRT